MSLPIPSLQDVARLVGPDVATTSDNYRRHLLTSGGVWGYEPCRRQARAVFSLEMTRAAAISACGRTGNPLGRPSNEEVGGLIWDLAKDRGKYKCHALKPRPLGLRADIAVKVDPLFFFLVDGRPTIFYLQPRRGHVPGAYGLRVISSAIRQVFAVDELEGADLLLFDLSCPPDTDERLAIARNLKELPPLEDGELRSYFQRFVDAHDLLVADGVEPKKRRAPRQPTPEPSFFDPAP